MQDFTALREQECWSIRLDKHTASEDMVGEGGREWELLGGDAILIVQWLWDKTIVIPILSPP